MKRNHIKMLISILLLTILIQFANNTSASEPVLDKFVYLPMVVRPNANLQITFISFAPSNGESQVDSEYVTITNVDNTAQNMTGWVLHDEGENFRYTFPEFASVLHAFEHLHQPKELSHFRQAGYENDLIYCHCLTPSDAWL